MWLLKLFFILTTAIDFVAHEVRVSSPGITIDLTPPVVTAVEIDTDGAYHTGKRPIKLTWHGVFEDPQSGKYSKHRNS